MEMGVCFDPCPVQMKIRFLRRQSLLRQVSKQRRNGIVFSEVHLTDWISIY